MKNLEDFFKTPTQEEVDRAWLKQMCYDGQMDDDEIEEFVDAAIKWKNKQTQSLQASHDRLVEALKPFVDFPAEDFEYHKDNEFYTLSVELGHMRLALEALQQAKEHNPIGCKTNGND